MTRTTTFIFLALLGSGVVYHLAEPGPSYSTTQPSSSTGYSHGFFSGSPGSSRSSSSSSTARGGFGSSAGSHGSVGG